MPTLTKISDKRPADSVLPAALNMQKETISIVPYMASVDWYADLLAQRLGLRQEATVVATADLNRGRIMGANGLQTLSVPIAGGGRNLRRPFATIGVSEHGSWRRVHWGAIFSAYGRTPYFEHYEHLFRPIWSHPWERLSDLNEALHRVITEIVFSAEIIDALPSDRAELERLSSDYADYWQLSRAKDGFVDGLSAIDMVFSLGPQSVFHLLHRVLYTPKSE